MSPYKLRNETRSIVGARVDYRKHPIVDTCLSRVGRGSGLTGPHRRTFATAILAFAHSMLTALRHPACLVSSRQEDTVGHARPGDARSG